MGGATFVCRPRTRARERGPVKGHYSYVATNVKITKQQLNSTISLTSSPPILIYTGATGHYLQAHGDHKNILPTQQGISVITSTHTTTLPMPPEMPKGANVAHIFPALKNSSLLSVGQLCDHGCEVHFDANTVTIKHKGETMLTGKRSHNTIGKLWILDPYTPKLEQIIEPVTEYINAALNKDTVANRIAFYHASMLSPVLSTWCDAIDAGRFTTWPALTSAQVRRHPPQSIAMQMGHLDQQRSNVRSTQQ
jgi:hypothetical protein